MNNEFKKIAKQLGIAIPACLLSIGVANAETVKENEMSKSINSAVSEIGKSNLVNNEVVKFLTVDFISGTDKLSPNHTNSHADRAANHSDDHDNRYHSDDHSDRSAYNSGNQCIPHSNSHSDYPARNKHTNNGGNKYHTDVHTDKQSPVTNCPPN